MEIWKPIKEYKNYEISNCGRVRSLNHLTKQKTWCGKMTRGYEGKMLKMVNKKGYNYVTIYDGKKKKGKSLRIHRIVAEYFVPNLEEKPLVHHVNGIKTDNRAYNLEWITDKEHALEHKDMVKISHNGIRLIDLNMYFGSRGEATRWLDKQYFKGSKNLQVVAQNISRVCKGNRNKTYGFRWEYYDKGSETSL